MQLEHFLTPYTKINSKWIKDKYKTRKLVEENIGRTLFDIRYSKVLYDPPHRVMEIKTKINKQALIKLKSFCTAKETINKMKRQLSEQEKTIANEATEKINFQNTQTAQAAQYQKNNAIKKYIYIGRKPKQTFLQRRHTNG